MKLGKDEIQKIVLGALLLISLVYCYFSMLLGPLQRQQEAASKHLVELDPQIAVAMAEINKTESIEKTAPEARETIGQVHALIPEGSPVAWFPPRVAEFFKARGVDKAATRLNNEFVDKELPGFRRMSWGIDVPKVDFVPLARAIAQLENEEPLVEIASLQIETSREDVESQHALFTVNNLVTQ